MSAGRPKFEDTLNKDKLTAWEQTLEDVHSGRTPLKLAAESWGTSTRTIQRSLEAKRESLLAATRYEKAAKFEEVPGVKDFFLAIDSRLKTERGRYHLKQATEGFWNDPAIFDRKPLTMLTKQDFQKAVIEIKKLPANTSYSGLVALRSLIRLGGFGKHEWLSEVLPTQGTRQPAEIPIEMRDEKTWKEITPKILGAVSDMRNDKMIQPDEREVFEFMFNTKRLHGPRTGNHGTDDPKSKAMDKVDREMWGLRLNAGKTRLDMVAGKIREWIYFAKKEEIWHVSREQSEFIAPGLAEYTENYVQRKELKDGDYLIPASFKIPRGREILHAACKIAKLTDFILHDLRRMFFTGLILAGVPMEVAVDLGVGWKKMDVPKQYYLTIKGASTKKWLPAVRDFALNNGQAVLA